MARAGFYKLKHFPIYNFLVNSMKRIAFSLISAVLLSAAVVPMAQAAHLNGKGGMHPAMLTPAATRVPDVEPSAQVRPVSSLEQAHFNRLDRAGNTPGSLNHQQAAPANDLDPHNLASVSPLQQMHLDHLDTSN